MSSQKTATRLGNQEPRIKYLPFELDNNEICDDTVSIMQAFSVDLLDWEKLVLQACASRHSDSDEPVYTQIGLSVPRQNGKTLIVEAYELYALVIEGRHILHTAHRVKTTKGQFQRMCRYFQGDSALKDQVLSIRRTNGEESITLKNGGEISYVSRGNGTARGITDLSLLVFDEAQELTESQLAAIMFVISASSTNDRQMFYLGTPPDPGCNGTVFTSMRDKILRGIDKETAWFEWSAEHCIKPNLEFDDIIDEVYNTNPSMGSFLSEKFTRSEFIRASPQTFSRERLGWWEEVAQSSAIISEPAWNELKTDDPPLDAKTAFGVKFSVDGDIVCVAACVMVEDSYYIEVIHHRSCIDGVQWLKDWLVERWEKAAAIVLDGKSGAADLAIHLLGRGVPKRVVYEPRTSTMIKASSMLLEAIKSKKLTHMGQPLLTKSILNARKRSIGNYGGFGFDSDTEDVTPVEACALALYGVTVSKRDPTRKQQLLTWGN